MAGKKTKQAEKCGVIEEVRVPVVEATVEAKAVEVQFVAPVLDRCATCRYWADAEMPGDAGTCHRYPPPWPNSNAQGWCGEWAGA